MVESYAVTVQYYVSSLIYGRTKAGDLLQHDSHPDYTKVGPSLICNGVTVEDLQNTVIYSATFAEWMQKIWEVPRVQDKLDRSVFDLILDNPYRLILDNYNEMLKGPEHTSVGVKMIIISIPVIWEMSRSCRSRFRAKDTTSNRMLNKNIFT